MLGSLEPQGRLFHPAFGETLSYRLDRVVDDPDEQVAQVVQMMARLVREDTPDPRVQADAAQAAQSVAGCDPIEGVFQWVRSRMQFVQDEQTAAPIQPLYKEDIVEVLVRPRDMVDAKRAQGDCDDYVMYGAALLRALGVPVNFVTVAADPAGPAQYTHVYLAAYPRGRGRVPMDISHGPAPGWDAPNVFGKRKEWLVDGPYHGPVAAVIGLGLMALSMAIVAGKVN